MNIYLELQRFKEVKKIKDETEMILKLYNKNVNVNSLLPKWFMLNMYNPDNKDNIKDYLIPYNAIKFNQLKIDLKNLYNIDYTAEIHNKINLTNKCNMAINNLLSIKEYNKINIEIKEEEYVIYRITEAINSIEFNIIEYKLHIDVVNKLKKNFIKGTDGTDGADGADWTADNLIICLIIRYNTLESYNQQLAVYPDFYNLIQKKYNIQTELFASSLNFSFPKYCSLYYDLEKYFGSQGTFDEYKFVEGKEDFYVANPPFDETIMTNMSIKLITNLRKAQKSLNFFITIPVWDEDNKYGKYMALDLLKQSPYISFITKLEKKHSKFFDYYENRYIYPCKMYFILLQNNYGKIKYPQLKNELLSIINTMFRLNKNIIGGSNIGDDSFLKFGYLIHYIIKHDKKKKININIKYDFEPPEYIKIKKIIKHEKTMGTKELIYSYISSLENFIYVPKEIKKIAMIDLTNLTSNKLIYSQMKESDIGRIKYIYDRLRWNYGAFFNILIKKINFFYINVNYLLEMPSGTLAPEKYDFIFISGNLSYNKIQEMRYYSEQMNYVLHMKQIIYLLNIQNIGGTAVYLISTCDTPIGRKNIALLQTYYKELHLIHNPDLHVSLSYVVCNKFLGISASELNKLNNIDKSIKLTNQNIFDKRRRELRNVTLPINIEKQTNIFLHNIFDINYSSELSNILDNFSININKVTEGF